MHCRQSSHQGELLWLAGVFYRDKSAVLRECCAFLYDSDGELRSAHSRDTFEIPIEFSCAAHTTDCSITDAVLWELLSACLSAHVSKHTTLRAQGWRKKKKMKVNERGVFENYANWEPSQVIFYWCLSQKIGPLGPQPCVQPWSHIGCFCMEGSKQLRSAEK